MPGYNNLTIRQPWLVRHHRLIILAPLLWLFHNQDQRKNRNEKHRKQKEDAKVCLHGRLALDHAKNHSIRPLGGGSQVRATGHHAVAYGRQHRARRGIISRNIGPQDAGMYLRMPHYHRGYAGNADAGPDVTHEIEQAGGIAHFLFGNRSVGYGSERNKHQSHGRALQYLRPEDVPVTGIQIESRHQIEAVAANDQSRDQKFARINFVDEYPHKWHKQKRPEPARQHGHARLQCRIAHQGLQPQRHHYGAAVEHKTQHRHQEHTGTIVANFENIQMHYGITRHQFAEHEGQKAGHREHRQNGNEMRSKPVGLLAFIQKDLERANAQRQQADAPVIHARRSLAKIRRIKDKEHGHDHRADADGNIDVEQPAPAIAISNPAAEHRSDHGCDDNSQRPKRHGFASLLRGKSFQQNRLGKRLQAAAGGALKDTKDDQCRKIGRQATEKGKQ